MIDQTEHTRLEQAQQELQHLMMEMLPADGNLELSEGLTLFRRSAITELIHGESSLAFCVIASGKKELFLGDDVFTYDKNSYLVTSMELPTVSHITQASVDVPYLSVKLDLEPALVSSVLLASAQETLAADDTTAFSVASLDTHLIDALIRLLTAVQTPGDAQFLAPMIKREIVYRLLKGNQGGRLSHVAGMGPASQRVSSALSRIRSEFDHPLRIPEIARDSGMSVSSFHDHFKKATGLTPLQFQKHLRLREARRLLLSEDIDVANAGFRVGYNDASHFNRDYKKLFGTSPMRDVENLRAAGPLATSPT